MMLEVKDTYYLVDEMDDSIVGKFEVDTADDCHVTGNCYSATAWTSDNQPIEWGFVSDVYCKWDSCTHWNFRGEDYDPEINKNEPGNNYYHLCGEEVFINHIRMMCFVWMVVTIIMEKYRQDRVVSHQYLEDDNTALLVHSLLNGYKIESAEYRAEKGR